MKSGPVILQLLPGSFAEGDLVCADKFSAHGLAVTRCANLSEVTGHIWAWQGKHNTRIVVIVDVSGHNDRQCVAALRTLHPGVGIVALVEPDNEADVIQLLHAGVDAHCVRSASCDLLIAIVLRLLWRLGVMEPPLRVETSSQRPGLHSSWGFVDQGWVFRSTAGHRVPLTTGERAFLMALLNAPAHKVSHMELIDAVNVAYKTTSGHAHQSRLGVMVSRMRRKFRQAGAPLPLKSVHNWGYMFVMDSHLAPGDAVRGQSVCSETEKQKVSGTQE